MTSVKAGTTLRATERMVQLYGVDPKTSFEVKEDQNPHEYFCQSEDPAFRGSWNKEDLHKQIRLGLLEVIS